MRKFLFLNRYPTDDAFLLNVHNEVLYQVQRLQSHPSIVLWSGNNENEAAISQNWWGIPPEQIEAAKDDYRKLYIDTVMAAVTFIDRTGSRPFVSSSPSNGIESVRERYIAQNPQDPLYGKDLHNRLQIPKKNSICFQVTFIFITIISIHGISEIFQFLVSCPKPVLNQCRVLMPGKK
jgi:hypothetical protein